MMRITTNSTLYTYQRNLLKSSNKLYSAMNAMMTGRKFDTYAADPAAATRAFKIHSSLNAVNAQYDNTNTVLNKFSTAWDIADDMIDKLVQDLGQAPALKGLNDTNLSTLNTQGDILLAGAESIVQSLNNKYGNNFIFNGADTQNPPFAIETDADGSYHLTYRNIRVDDPDTLDDVYIGADKQPIMNNDETPQRPYTNEEMLQKWADEEHLYVDIGIGFELDKDGNVIDSTAFDASISGTEFIGGHGMDGEGDPKNIISTMLRLAEIFKDFDQENMSWGDAGGRADAERLANKLFKGQETLSNQHTKLDTQATYLQTNKNQLESTFDALNSEREGIENIDETEAIMTLVWAQTSYNAALQVGAGRGVALLAAQQAGLPLYEYTPMQIKQAVCGNGHADKRQIQQMVKLLLGLRELPKPDDAADALGVAICHANTMGPMAETFRIH